MTETFTIAQPRLALVDPHDCTDVKDERALHEAFFDALVTRDANLRIVPGLAHRWHVSDDARTWTFHLREGVRFHNDEPLNSETVQFSLARMSDPNMGATLGASAVYAQYLQGMSIRCVDAHTVQLTLPAPNADLLDILVDGYILPPRATQTLGDAFKHQPIGTGAYRFVEGAPHESVSATANPAHFRGAPRFQRVTWRCLAASAARLDALVSRQADVAVRLAPHEAAQLAQRPDVQRVDARDTTCIIFLYNCARGPLQHTLVRQALNYAIDKEQIIQQVLHGAGYALNGFMHPQLFGADATLAPYPHDPARARALLASAGYADGLALTLDSPTALPNEALALSQLIAQQLAEVGVSVRINVIEDRTLYAHKVRLKEIHDLCCFDSSPLSTYRVLREKLSAHHQGAWWEGYANAEVETLLAQANRTADTAQREQIYRACFQRIHADPPWLFLYNPQIVFGVRDAARGWAPRADGCVSV